MEYLKKFETILIDSLHTGSRVICNPAPTDTDDDWIILVGEGGEKFVKSELEKDGFELGGSFDQDESGGDFYSYKKGDLNIILTTDEDFIQNSRRATLLCRELNLLKKEDRITVFRAIREDEWPYDGNPTTWNTAFG